MRAAVRGVIDFRRANFRDVNWWRRCSILLGEIAREDEAAVVHASYLYHLALVANGSLTDEGFKSEQKKARQAFNDYVGCTHPWAERVRRLRQLDDVKKMAELYRQLVGDPDDPITRERWRRESAELEAQCSNKDPGAATMAAVTAAIRQAAQKEKPKPVALD